MVKNVKTIEEDKTLASRLASTERDLERALETGGLALWDWDMKTGIVKGSKNMALFFGISIEDAENGVPGNILTDAIHPDDRERVGKEMDLSLSRKLPFESEYRIVSQEGTIRWVIVRGKPEFDADGNRAVSFPGIILDITRRKQNELNASFIARASKMLASSLNYKKTLHTVAELAVPDIADWCTVTMMTPDQKLEQAIIVHKDPKKIEWAKAYSQQRPLDINDATNASVRVIRSGKAEHYETITDEMLQQSAQNEEELALARDLRLSSFIIVPIHDQNTNIGAITMILTEEKRHYSEDDFVLAQELGERVSLAITNARLYELSVRELEHRKKLQLELKEANRELERRVKRRTQQLHDTNASLERSNSELQNFAYVASHDLQEPLRKIQAFGDILHDEYGDVLGDGKDYLERMQAAANRMSTLIEDLLSFSRVTTHAKPFTSVDLNSILEMVLEDLSDRIERTQGRVKAEELPTIEGDETQLRQLLQNLIANALKFHKPDEAPIVKVHGKVSDGQLLLEIADNGIGFEEKYADRIFAVFQRLHGRDEYEGTGIGLAVCKKIVERHHGAISVKSSPRKGTTFLVSLPLVQKREEQEK